MYISELVELFRQFRGNSPFDHMHDHFVAYQINRRRKSKSLLPATIDRTQLKRRFYQKCRHQSLCVITENLEYEE